MDAFKSTLPKEYLVDNKYKVILFIKQGINAETYRVKDSSGNIRFLKLFNYAKLNRTSFDQENNLLEIEFLKKIKHENIVTYIDSGEIIFENKKFAYLVLDFISGETLAERISRKNFTNFYDIKSIIIDILNGLNYLHSLPEPIIHNEITPQNIMLDLSDKILKSKIIDFGYARSFHQSTKVFNKIGLNLNYVASECFNGLYSPQSDIYSVGAVMYQLIYGLPPWFVDVSNITDIRTIEEKILQKRSKSLSFPKVDDEFIGYNESIKLILKKALSQDIDTRFQSADEFLKALNGEIEVENIDKFQKVKSDEKPEKKFQIKKTKEKGFDAIAGMEDIKSQIKTDVIDALNNSEEYKKYGIRIPNGILFYGPPGCGKTFFAKCLSEEINAEFLSLTPANLKSKYVNATQENIAKLFKEAEEKAPIVIFIDEINELLPNRDKDDYHEMSKSAVNEFLAQMDRTSEKGILIIGATNFPHNIDPAALRSGRLEKKFYISPPDFDARKKLFELYLKERPLDLGVDFEYLAKLTENYVSADIEFIVNEAAKKALKEKSRISMKILEDTLKNIKPSVSLQELIKYEKIKSEMSGENLEQKNKRPPIGFRK